jgi:hypothetical protein
MAGVPRSYEYMFVAYAWAELYREMGVTPQTLEEMGYSGATSLYRDAFNRISKIHDSYTKVHGEKTAERTYLRVIKITSQEFWAGKVELPLRMKHPSNLENNWGQQHDQIYDEWSTKSDEEIVKQLEAILGEDAQTEEIQKVLIEKPNYGLRSVKIRRGQPKFRKKLLSLYDSCMVSGCKIEDVLEACHIVPYSVSHDNSPENGILLRSDLHTLLDCGLMSITEDFRVGFSHDEAPSHYDDFTDTKIEFAPSLDRSKILENVRRFISLNQD